MNHDSRILFALALWSGLVLLSTASGHLHSPDCEINFRTTRSLAEGRGFAIDPLPDGFGTRRGIDGKEYPQYGPLQPILASPLYTLGASAARFVPESWLTAQAERLTRTVFFYRPLPEGVGDFDGIYPPDHTERVARIAVSMFNPLVTWITFCLLAFWARRRFNDLSVWWLLPTIFLLGTIAWPHSRPFYSESLATLLLLWSAFLADGLRGTGTSRNVTRAAAVGVLAGCALLTRVDSIVALPGIAILAAGRIFTVEDSRGLVRKLGLVAVGFLALLLVGGGQLWLNARWYGGPFASGYSDQPEGVAFNIPFLHSLWIYLLSPGKSIFWYSPPLVISLALWGSFWKRDRLLAGSLIVIALGYLLVVGRWQNLGGWCWGPRHLVQLTPFLLFPLPLILSTARQSNNAHLWLGTFAVTLVWGFLVQFSGVLVDYMWPLDQKLRGLPPGSDTQLVIATYSPLLHLNTWSMEGDPDWLLADLWRSGVSSARVFVATAGTILIGATAGSAWLLFHGRNPSDGPAQ